MHRFIVNAHFFIRQVKRVRGRHLKLHSHRAQCVTRYLAHFGQSILLHFTGVFFNNRVEHVKFVDFCGKYRLPLLQYLCSRKCIESRDGDEVVSCAMMRKVLLG